MVSTVYHEIHFRLKYHKILCKYSNKFSNYFCPYFFYAKKREITPYVKNNQFIPAKEILHLRCS